MKEIKDISKVFELFDKYGLSEFSFRDGEMEIRLCREEEKDFSNTLIPKPEAVNEYVEQIIPSAKKTENKNENINKKFKEIKSPINGNFYRAPSPNARSFVEVGDKVKEGQVLCIIESMKLMNEIKSNESGVITDIKIENAQPVTKGQVLFIVE